MATQPIDLWGDLSFEGELRLPVVVLREQAALLGPKTKNLIQAEVSAHPDGSHIFLNFDLVVPALDGYRYRLFRLSHELAPMYPVRVSGDTDLGSEEEFVLWLRRKLASPETRKIIGSLLAQIQK